MVKQGKIFAIDFDGTLYLGDTPYPTVDASALNMKLIQLIEKGQQLHPEDDYVLWTCRQSDEEVKPALDAIASVSNIKWTAVNDNIPRIKLVFGNPRKIIADVYIDDRAISVNNFNQYIPIIMRGGEGL